MKALKTLIMLAIVAVLSLSILAGCAKTPEVTETTAPPAGDYSTSGDGISVDSAREATGAEAAKGAGPEEGK